MEEKTLIIIVVVYSLACAGMAAWLAGEKNHSDGIWALLGLFFGFLALIAIAGAPVREAEKKSIEDSNSFNFWICPKCDQKNDQILAKCNRCGSVRP
jgi:ribosomal protein L40E